MLATLAASAALFIASPAAPAATFTPPSMTMPAPAPAPAVDVVASEDIDPGYGGQILLVDAAGIAIMLAGGSGGSSEVVVGGLLTMGFGPGLVHASHGRTDAALASMLLRPTVTFAAMYVGAHLEDCSGEDHDLCGLGGALLGGLVGYGAVAVFDAAYLAREKRTERPRTWAPAVAASPQGVQVGIGGSF